MRWRQLHRFRSHGELRGVRLDYGLKSPLVLDDVWCDCLRRRYGEHSPAGATQTQNNGALSTTLTQGMFHDVGKLMWAS